jgi:hypothetical protein
MTEDDKQARKEFLGVVGAVVVAIIIIGFISWGDSPTEHSQETKVVGTYKGCDIIQWHYGALAEYKYFLHCNNTQSAMKNDTSN